MIKGTRVGALLLPFNNEAKTISFLGWGTFVGMEIPPADIGWPGYVANSLGIVAPKIKLDNGIVIWGCECFWFDEKALENEFARCLQAGWRIVETTIDGTREKAREYRSEGIFS